MDFYESLHGRVTDYGDRQCRYARADGAPLPSLCTRPVLPGQTVCQAHRRQAAALLCPMHPGAVSLGCRLCNAAIDRIDREETL
jgi:hypothetical protein